MKIRYLVVLALFVAVSGCSGNRLADFEDTGPPLVLEEYFAGKTTAWGIFEDRFGKLRRQFTVDITGTWNGETLTLDERFVYEDGERATRVWQIRKTGPGMYEGRADDVAGVATGEVAGNALNWRYDLDLRVGDATYRVAFDDWMYLQSPTVLVNRAYVSKFGIGIGSVTLFFTKGAANARPGGSTAAAAPPRD